MPVWVAYSFLNKNDSEKVEKLFNQLPDSVMCSVEEYRDSNDRLARKILRLL